MNEPSKFSGFSIWLVSFNKCSVGGENLNLITNSNLKREGDVSADVHFRSSVDDAQVVRPAVTPTGLWSLSSILIGSLSFLRMSRAQFFFSNNKV